MKINNFFQINNWEIKKYFYFIISLQILLISLIILDTIGIDIPILRQSLGFIFLTFIPGFIILRIIGLHNLSNLESVLYAAGLSLFFLMSTGFLINIFYPFIGISKPLSFSSLVISINIIILALLILSTRINKNYHKPDLIELNSLLSYPVLYLLLIPFIAIIGSYIVNVYHNNILLMLLILLIGFTAILICFTDYIPKKLYPLAIFSMALALLFYRSLVPFYLWGTDIQYEYYFSKLVLVNGVWNWNISHPYNGILSTNILAPIYAFYCNLDISWVFKTIYQFIFALTPLGLYLAFKKQTSETTAFLACFLFISISTFYMEMPALARQEISQLFAVLLILILITINKNKIKMNFMFIIFSFSLIISHYSLSYIYMFIFISAWILIYLDDKFGNYNHIYRNLDPIMSRVPFLSDKIRLRTSKDVWNYRRYKDNKISLSFIGFFAILTIAWYIYTSSSSSIIQVVHIGGQISSSIVSDFLNSNNSQGLHLLSSSSTFLHNIGKYLHIISQFFIIIGIIIVLLINRMKFNRYYIVFSLINLSLLFFSILVPFFASSLNTTRLYQISLMFLAPFCVIGGLALLKIIKINKINQFPKKALCIFFVIILLFSSGFVYEVLKDDPTSNSLSQNYITTSGSPEEKVSFYSGYTPQQNVFSIQWLSDQKNPSNLTKIYSGATNVPQIWAYVNSPYNSFYLEDIYNLTSYDKDSYIYLGYVEISDGIIGSWETKYLGKTIYHNMTDIYPFLKNENKIYSNGKSEIYYGA